MLRIPVIVPIARIDVRLDEVMWSVLVVGPASSDASSITCDATVAVKGACAHDERGCARRAARAASLTHAVISAHSFRFS
jgi:hypothetical protein